MKKFFSLLCAFAIALSVSAAPASISKQVQKAKADRAFVENNKPEKKVQKAAAKKTIHFNKVGKSITALNGKDIKKAAPARPHVIKSNKQIARAPQGKKEDISILFNNENADLEFDDYVEEAGWWQIQAENDDYYLTLSNVETDDVEGVYGIDDLALEYSFMYDYAADDYVDFTDGSITVTVDSESGAVTFAGSLEGSDDNTYNIIIVYEELPIEPGDFDVEIGKVKETFYASENDVYIVMTSADGESQFTFDIVVAEGETELELGHTYTIDDMYGNNTRVSFNKVTDYLIEAELTKTVDEEGLEHFVVTAKDSYDRVFHITYDEIPFELTGEVIDHEFAACAALSYSDYFEDWTIRAEDDVFTMQLDIFSDDPESVIGEFSSENKDFDLDYTYVNIWAGDDYNRVYAHDAAAVITERNDTILIAATIIGEDGVVYNFNAFFAAPTKQGEVTIEATNLVIDDSWFDFFGVVWADASNDDYEVSLTIYPEIDYIGETFEFGDYASGTVNGINIYSGSFIIENNEEGLHLTGKALCFDNIEYTFNFIYVKPEKTREEVLDIVDAQLTVVAEDGYWYVEGLNEDRSRYITILAFFEESIAGTYTTDDLYAGYTYVANTYEEEDGLYAEEFFDLIDAEITVTLNEDGTIATIAGTLLGQGEEDPTDVPEFSFNFTADVEEYVEDNEYDAEEDFAVDFESYEIDDEYLEEYGVLFVWAENADNEFVNLELWLPEGATELVAGEYAVSAEEGEPQTIFACILDGNSIYGSFAGSFDEEGYINSPWWFIADGKVTVQEDGEIIVDCVNTKGAAVRSKLGFATAVDNINADAVAAKRLENANLIIEKNGVRYNVLGTVVK